MLNKWCFMGQMWMSALTNTWWNHIMHFRYFLILYIYFIYFWKSGHYFITYKIGNLLLSRLWKFTHPSWWVDEGIFIFGVNYPFKGSENKHLWNNATIFSIMLSILLISNCMSLIYHDTWVFKWDDLKPWNLYLGLRFNL